MVGLDEDGRYECSAPLLLSLWKNWPIMEQ